MLSTPVNAHVGMEVGAARRGTGRPVSASALGLVMGDVDVVRALGIADIPVAFFGYPGDPARFSRHVHVALPWIDHWQSRDELLAALLAFAGSQPEPPVL